MVTKYVKTSLQKFKKFFCKGAIILSIVGLSAVMPLTLPFFAVVSICTYNKEYMTLPFIILDLRTIISFVVNA